MQKNEFVLVSTKVLPDVFEGVLHAKELLAQGKAANASQAIKMAGISRSAFYKYRDYVFAYSADESSCINLSALLSDKAGVFSAMTTLLYENGANLVTVNQEKPIDGAAAVSLTIDINHIKITIDELLLQLKTTDGILSVKVV
ncbi:MAG: ACT domain-containing protein [Ruminococcaceae bacterium]|nr:ACT domain-containing protein [Oscillospiraceae bacterium]